MVARRHQGNESRIQFIDVAELRAFTDGILFDGMSVNLIGGATPGDGAGGFFCWDSSSSVSEDAPSSVGTVVKLTNTAIGRFIRTDMESISALFFGANTDGATNNGVGVQVALEYALANGRTLNFPAGRYNFTTRAELEGVGNINITADPGAVIISNISSGGGAISLRADRVELVIAADITRGDTTFDVADATGITVGQHFTLRSSVAVEALRSRPARHTGVIVSIEV